MIIERLEPRTLFTAVLPFTFVQTAGALKITGSNSTSASLADQIQLTQSGGVITATDIHTGASIATSGPAITSIVVDLQAGNDYLRLRNNDGTKPVTIATSLFGGAGDDTVYGGDGVDLIATGDNNDKLVGRGGNDTLDGGNGFDTADYSYETRAINVSLDGGPNDGVISIAEHDNVVCEAVVGGSGNDILIGNAASADWLDGGAGNDTIAGGGGNDTVTGGIGADAVLGQGGSDSGFIKDGTVDTTGDVLEQAQIDNKNAGAPVSDVGGSVPVPVSQALAKVAKSIAAAVAVNPESPNVSNPANLDQTFGVDFSEEYHGVSLADPIGGGSYGEIRVAQVLLQPTSEFESDFVDAGGSSTDKIIVVGSIASPVSSSFDFFVMRLNKDGTVDHSFGDYDSGTGQYLGYTTTDFTDVAGSTGVSGDLVNSAYLDSDGNIFVVGYSEAYYSEIEGYNTDIAIAEYNGYDGSLNTYFGALDPSGEFGFERLGKMVYDLPDTAGAHTSDDYGTGIVVDLHYNGEGYENRITISADVNTSTGENQVALLQFYWQGTPASFDDPLTTSEVEGFNTINYVGGQQGSSSGLAEDQYGNYWLAATRYNPEAPSTPGVMTFNHDGGLVDGFTSFTDPTLSGDLDGTAEAIAINGDQVVVVGQTYLGEGFIAQGQIGSEVELTDTSSITPASPSARSITYTDVTFDGKGRILATGTAGDPYSGGDFIVTRVDSGLTEDKSFNDGSASVEIDPQDGQDDEGRAILVQDDGAIVVAGTSLTNIETPGTLSVVRLIGGDPVSEQTIDPSVDPTTAQATFKWINPDTGLEEDIPLELFQNAIHPTTPTPLVIDGTDSDDYITVTSTFDEAGNGVFAVRVNDGSVTFWDRRYVSEVDINTHAGTDVVRINDLLYSLPIDPITQSAELLAVDITGEQNHLSVFVGATPDGEYAREITELTETSDPALGTITQLPDDPHTPGPPDSAKDENGDDIPADPVFSWTAGDFVGSTVLNYTEEYPDFGYQDFGSINITLVDTNSPPVAGDDVLPDISGPVTIQPSDLLANDSAGPASESGQTLDITQVFDGEGGSVVLDTSGATPVVVFTPTAGYTGPASFTYEITDGNVPAGTQPHTALGTVTFNIVAANSAPTDLSVSPATIAENSLPNTEVGTFTTVDPDTGNTFTCELVTGTGDTDNNAFTIVDDKLVAKNPFDFETQFSYSIRVKTTDQGNESFEKILTINVSNVNEAPTDLSVSPSTVAENVAIGTAVGTFSSTDPDTGDSFTYTLVSTGTFPDNSAFTISNVGGVGTLKTNAAINYETKNSYSIRVRTTDALGLWTEKTLTIGVTNVNEAPTNVVLLSNAAPENQPVGTALSTFGGQDPDSPETLTYSLVNTGGANDNSFFNITNAGGVYTLRNSQNLDYEAHNSYNIRVRVTDAGGLFFDKFLTFSLINQNEAPTANAGGPYNVVQGATITLAGTGSDPEQAANTLTYAWDLDGDGVFGETAISNTNGIPNGAETGATPTFIGAGAIGLHAIQLRVTDSTGSSTFSSTTVNVTAPVQSGVKFVGTSIGTAGSYKNDPNSTRDKAFDGDPNTFFDSDNKDQNTAWTGIDVGTVRTVNLIKFTPRKGFESRMYGGKFQASNDKNFATGVVTLYTITGVPQPGVTNVTVSAPGQYRYFRYLGPVNSNGNVAEIEFYGTPGSGVDSTAPTAPKGISSPTRTTKTISLSWTASTDYVGVTRYDIYRNGAKVGSNTTPTFTDTGLSPNVNYVYTIKAIDAANNASAFSAAFSIKTLPDTTKPSKPGTPVKGTVTKTSIALTWAASTDDIAVVGYYVYRDNVKVATTNATPSFTDTGLKTLTTYAYYVVAFDAAGNLSPLSATLSVKTI